MCAVSPNRVCGGGHNRVSDDPFGEWTALSDRLLEPTGCSVTSVMSINTLSPPLSVPPSLNQPPPLPLLQVQVNDFVTIVEGPAIVKGKGGPVEYVWRGALFLKGRQFADHSGGFVCVRARSCSVGGWVFFGSL